MDKSRLASESCKVVSIGIHEQGVRRDGWIFAGEPDSEFVAWGALQKETPCGQHVS